MIKISFIVLSFLSVFYEVEYGKKIFHASDHPNVLGDGKHDDYNGIQELLKDPGIDVLVLGKDRTFLIDLDALDSSGDTYSERSLIIRSNKELVVNGIIKIKSKHNYKANLKTLLYGNNIENFKISGSGKIDANGKNLQKFNKARFRILHFENSRNLEISLHSIVDNNSKPFAAPTHSICMLRFDSCSNIAIKGTSFRDWIYESVCLKYCSNTIIDNVKMFGGENSWSGIQIKGGKNHVVLNTLIENAGASSFGIDTEGAILVDNKSINNRRYNGFNFGHAGPTSEPAINCTVINCSAVTNIDTVRATNKNYSGFNINSTSENINLIDCIADGYSTSYGSGFKVSISSITMKNIKASNCKVGLKNNNSKKITLIDSDLAGSQIPYFETNVLTEKDYYFKNVKLSNDNLSDTIVINTDLDSLTVVNENITPYSSLKISSKKQNSLTYKILKKEFTIYFNPPYSSDTLYYQIL